MDRILQIFNNRELAAFTLLLAFLLYAFVKSTDSRKGAMTVLRAFFAYRIQASLLLNLIYSLTVMVFLWWVGFWDATMMKDSLFWFAGTGFIVLMQLNDHYKTNNLFLSIVRDNIKMLLLLEFLVSVRTFSYVGELVFLLITTVLVMVQGVAERDPDKQRETS